MLTRVKVGQTRGVFLGAAFAFGWTPCIGPVLAVIVTMAASTRSRVGRGGTSGGVLARARRSFLIMATGLDRLERHMRALRRHGRTVEILSGTLLLLVGFGYVTGTWNQLFIPLQRRFTRSGWPPI